MGDGGWATRRSLGVSSREGGGKAASRGTSDGRVREELGAEVRANRVGLDKEEGHRGERRVKFGEG